MRVLITGSDGFIARNLAVHLRERQGVEVLGITRSSTDEQLVQAVQSADIVFHLAGVNRPQDPAEFTSGNRDFTRRIAELVAATGRKVPVVLSSSIQAERDNPYGISKRAAETEMLSRQGALPGGLHIFRLPNVFGKWSRPNYNSAVATFCHNIARGLPINIHDPLAPVSLVYVDDVVAAFLAVLDAHVAGAAPDGQVQRSVEPVYTTTVGELAAMIRGFHDGRMQMVVDRVGDGLRRALYATYLSFLQPEAFAYPIVKHVDPRGEFAEVLKTPDCGQFSYFTAHPGITRGGHFHHTKNEKFLVIRGRARFGFRHVLTGATHHIETSGDEPRVVDTVPGWAHDITNIGDGELVVMLWANEAFDRQKPDTIMHKV